MLEKLQAIGGNIKIRVTTIDNHIIEGFYYGWERDEENPDIILIAIKNKEHSCEEVLETAIIIIEELSA